MRKRRPPKSKRTKQVRRELLIETLSRSGEGVAGDIRVPFALPGEEVTVSASGKAGTVIERTVDAPERTAPACQHFGLPGDGCGGCTLQHVSSDHAMEIKKERLLSAVRMVYPEAELHAVHASPAKARRRATFAVRPEAAGFRALHSTQVVSLKMCEVVRPELFGLLPSLRNLSRALNAPFEAQVTTTRSGLDVALSAANSDDLGFEGREALATFAEGEDLARLAIDGVPLAERRAPRLEFGGVSVPLTPGVFLQATEDGEAALTDEVLKATDGAQRVADLFCGLGTFALPLSQTSKVSAYDSAGPAVSALSVVAKAAGRALDAQQRDLFSRPLQPSELKDFDAVVFDPPRAGAAAQAPLLAEAKVPMIVAVSCNPDSLSRDIRSFAEAYDLTRLVLVDQFGWSAHLEAVAVFQRR